MESVYLDVTGATRLVTARIILMNFACVNSTTTQITGILTIIFDTLDYLTLIE
jgi:hypothetical protein